MNYLRVQFIEKVVFWNPWTALGEAVSPDFTITDDTTGHVRISNTRTTRLIPWSNIAAAEPIKEEDVVATTKPLQVLPIGVSDRYNLKSDITIRSDAASVNALRFLPKAEPVLEFPEETPPTKPAKKRK